MQKNTIVVLGLSTVFLIAIISFFANTQSQKPTIDDLISLPAQPTAGLSQPNISPIAQRETNQPDPTADWKAYSIPFLKASIKIPPGWFIATDQTNKNKVRILSSSPEASPEASQSGFKLDIEKISGVNGIKNIVDLRIALTDDDFKEYTQKGKVAGESEVKIDDLAALYRELQVQTGAIQQLYLITKQGEVGILESIPKDENQINIFKIIISTIKSV